MLARSSPDDKLTLAKGLNASLMVHQASRSWHDGRWNQQGSRSDECDMGFAMGIEGTQIAKDAAVLLNVNFTYIVVVAK